MYNIWDAVQCYVDSEKDIIVAQNLYAFRYPGRPQLDLKTLDIIQCYFDSEQDLNITENLYAFRYPTQKKLDQDTLRKMFSDINSTQSTSSENLKLINQPETSMSNINNISQNSNCEDSLFPYDLDLPIKKEIIMQDSDDDEKDIPLPALATDETNLLELNMEDLPPTEELVSHIKVEDNGAEIDIFEIIENKLEPDIDNENTERKRRKSLDNMNFENTEKKIKLDTEEPPKNILDTKILNSIPIIYTTRLDDMLIFQINLKEKPPKDIFDTILYESKPLYNNCNYPMTGLINKKIDLNKIYNTLDTINRNKRKSTIRKKTNRPKEDKETIKRTDTMVFDHLNKSLLIDLTDDNDDYDNVKSSPNHSKKRKKKSIKNNLSKGLKGSKVVVPKVQSNMREAMVYTTRLNNMAIFQKKVKIFNAKYILKEILRESKPIYKYYPQQNTIRGINYKTLKYKLHLMNNKNRKNIDGASFENIRKGPFSSLKLTNISFQIPGDENYKLIFVGKKIRNEINVEEECVTEKTITKHYVRNPNLTEIVNVDKDIACIIHNKWSKTTEIYITDSRGKIIEHTKKLSNPLNLYSDPEFSNPKIDSSKKMIKFQTCCWFNRENNIEEVWMNSNMEIVRFMRTIHECPVDNCECCCKPVIQSRSFRISKDVIITPQTKFNQKKKQLNLITTALEYRKPTNEETNDQNTKSDKTIENNNYLIQITKKGQINNQKETVNYYSVDSKGRVDFNANFSEENPDSELIKDHFISKSDLCFRPYIICCKITQDRLVSDLKKNSLSPYTIKYIEGPSISTICNECENIQNRRKYTKLIIDPPIVEHTRKFTVVAFIKVLYHTKTDPCESKSIVDVLSSTINSASQNPQLNQESNSTTPSTDSSTTNQYLTLKSIQFPEIETVIKGVHPSIAESLKEQLKNMNFCFQNGKLVASLKFIIATTSQEFESLAKLLQLTETKLKKINVPSGTSLNFYVESNSMKNKKLKKPIKNQKLVNNTFDFITMSLSSDKISYRKSLSSYIKTKYNYAYNTDSEDEKIVMPVISNVFSLKENSSSENNESLKKIYLVGKDLKSNNEAVSPIPSTSKSKTDDLFVLHLTSNNIIENTVDAILKDKGNKPLPEDEDLDQFESQIPMNVIVDYKSASYGHHNNENKTNMPDLISDLLEKDRIVKKNENQYLKNLLETKTTKLYSKQKNFNK